MIAQKPTVRHAGFLKSSAPTSNKTATITRAIGKWLDAPCTCCQNFIGSGSVELKHVSPSVCKFVCLRYANGKPKSGFCFFAGASFNSSPRHRQNQPVRRKTHTKRRSSQKIMPDVFWNPLIRQEREPDTLFLFDADVQSRVLPGKGGFIQPDAGQAGTTPWGNSVQIVPGKFRAGIASLRVPYYGSVWMPGDGLLPIGEWTIEFWVRRGAGYGGYPNMVPVEWVFGDRGNLTFLPRREA